MDSFGHRSSTSGGELMLEAVVDVSTPVVNAKGGCGGSTIGAQGLAAGISWSKSSVEGVWLSIIPAWLEPCPKAQSFIVCVPPMMSKL